MSQIIAAGDWLRVHPGLKLAVIVGELRERFRLQRAAEIEAALLLAGRRAGR